MSSCRRKGSDAGRVLVPMLTVPREASSSSMWRTFACLTIAKLTPQAFATSSSVPPFSVMNLAIP